MATIFMIPRGAPNEDDHVVLSVGGRDYKIYKGVEYVVREKGEWRRVYEEGEGWVDICTRCKEIAEGGNFCSNCGSDMRRGENG